VADAFGSLTSRMADLLGGRFRVMPEPGWPVDRLEVTSL
jgi:hypothetical protein